MRYKQTCLSVSSMVLVVTASVQAEESAFRYDPAKVETGVVYHYVKSNIDGSHRGQLSLFVASKDRLESLKWQPGEAEATLVTAILDWDRFSVQRFESWRLRAGRQPQPGAILNFDEDSQTAVAQFGGMKQQITIDHWPWHSYDFDFSSLNFTLRHLRDPQKSFKVGVTDVVRTDTGPKLTDKGQITIAFRRETNRHGHPCREYSIDGPGLEYRGGTMWVRKADGVLVDYEIALPDEPGYTSGKLMLSDVQRMTSEEWDDYKSSRISAN